MTKTARNYLTDRVPYTLFGKEATDNHWVMFHEKKKQKSHFISTEKREFRTFLISSIRWLLSRWVWKSFWLLHDLTLTNELNGNHQRLDIESSKANKRGMRKSLRKLNHGNWSCWRYMMFLDLSALYALHNFESPCAQLMKFHQRLPISLPIRRILRNCNSL